MLLKPMTNEINDSCQDWLQKERTEMTLSEWLNPQEARLLQTRAGTSEGFQVLRSLYILLIWV